LKKNLFRSEKLETKKRFFFNLEIYIPVDELLPGYSSLGCQLLFLVQIDPGFADGQLRVRGAPVVVVPRQDHRSVMKGGRRKTLRD
jgi:hypothetical protein